MSTETPEQLMDRGAAAFKANNFAEAAVIYTQVIDLCRGSPNNNNTSNSDLLTRALNNRSGASCSLGQYELALSDAQEICSKLHPQLAKAWARCAAALHGLKRYAEAATAYATAAQATDRKGAAEPASYLQSASEMRALIAEGKGVVAQEDRDLFYVDKYAAEAAKASSAGNDRAAADALSKAIRHERQRRVAGFGVSTHATAQAAADETPRLATLLLKRSACFSQIAARGGGGDDDKKGSADLDAALEDAEEALSLCRTSPHIHARVVQSLLALGRLRSARQAYDAAAAALAGRQRGGGGGGGIDEEPLRKALQAVEAAERTERQKEERALQQEAEARRELEAAIQSRSQRGDAVSVDDRKMRRVDDAAAAKVGAGLLGGMSKHKTEYCRFCSQNGHSAAFCPLKRQAGGR